MQSNIFGNEKQYYLIFYIETITFIRFVLKDNKTKTNSHFSQQNKTKQITNPIHKSNTQKPKTKNQKKNKKQKTKKQKTKKQKKKKKTKKNKKNTQRPRQAPRSSNGKRKSNRKILRSLLQQRPFLRHCKPSPRKLSLFSCSSSS